MRQHTIGFVAVQQKNLPEALISIKILPQVSAIAGIAAVTPLTQNCEARRNQSLVRAQRAARQKWSERLQLHQHRYSRRCCARAGKWRGASAAPARRNALWHALAAQQVLELLETTPNEVRSNSV
jgi:hypothetical protein